AVVILSLEQNARARIHQGIRNLARRMNRRSIKNVYSRHPLSAELVVRRFSPVQPIEQPIWPVFEEAFDQRAAVLVIAPHNFVSLCIDCFNGTAMSIKAMPSNVVSRIASSDYPAIGVVAPFSDNMEASVAINVCLRQAAFVVNHLLFPAVRRYRQA